MARDYIEFIQAQQLPWQATAKNAEIQNKILSEDPETKACTVLCRVQPGWLSDTPSYLDCNEELYVLEGSVEINGMNYGEGCYGYFPKGTLRKVQMSRTGGVFLRFLDGDPMLKPQQQKQQLVIQPEGFIPCLNTMEMNWDHSLHDIRLAHLGFGRKNLRIDPKTGARTFLFMISPQTHPDQYKGPREHHPTVEEGFIISGDLTGHVGVMKAGAYFWRPPEIPHGPFGSKMGCLSLIRFVGGAHVNHWSEQSFPFHFDMPYQPELPEHLAHLKGQFWQESEKF